MARRRLLAFLLGSLVAFITAESALRLQQHLGPFLDLEFRSTESLLAGLSDELNHRPLAENPYHVDGIGDWTYRYDANGIRRNPQRSPCPDDEPSLRVLFLGDSFMQGYDDATTIPQAAYVWLRAQGVRSCLEFSNAGFWSYAPSIYIVQARKLLPLLRPDLVVVDLDETDLMDDYIRYRELEVRNGRGDLVAVRATPREWMKARRLLEIRQSPLFSVRMMSLLYLTKVRIPAATRAHRAQVRRYGQHPPLALSLYEGGDTEERFADEITNFESNLHELTSVLKARLRSPGRVLFSYHPHYLHLEPDARGRRYPHTISEIIGRVAMQQEITFMDASAALAERCQPQVSDCFLWPQDPYSHFTPLGIRLYGGLIGERLLPLAQRLDNGLG